VARPSPWTVEPEWEGSTVFIIAGGDSVSSQPVDRLRGRHVIVINSSFEIAPWADFLIFADPRLWRAWMRDKAKSAALKAFKGRIVGATQSFTAPGVLHIGKAKPPPGLTSRRDRVMMHNTTLTGAINLAAHLVNHKPAAIVLLGADMRRGLTGKCHHHKPHPFPLYPENWTKKHMPELRQTVEPLQARGIEVFNTSPISLIDWWPKRPLEDFL
jgi:hypothetical protein